MALLAFCASASGAPSHKLKSFQARSAAETVATDFYIRRKLDNAKVGRCKRRARPRIVCKARATGETKRLLKTCDLRIRIRAVYKGYWDEAAAIVWRRCRKEPKPLLTYAAALASIQAEANRFAGRPTAVTYMFRRDDVTFSGTAKWALTDPHGCKDCGYDSDADSFYDLPTTQTCSVDLVATLAGNAISVANDGYRCL